GLRETNEVVEREGVRRARARAETADLRLAVFDTTQWPPASDALKAVCGGETIIVANKSDLLDCPSPMEWEGAPVFSVSVETGAGIDGLLIALTQAVADGFDEVAAPVVTRARHREALNECMRSLVDFLARPDKLAHPEIGGEDLRLAARALGRVTGRVDVEDLLDVIFSDFCIGK
ncbi:MAG: tRNA uridine-5-carboxymethylaminomethyl(34) synthesis GTPase MnmE, partial [Rhodospirillaceae bacterium]|nr:tRNA uridine-5-carboxymethylaminomethyl(34) synthesis GTPase MnmE [Rhodospirillaceae bacterium]